MTAFLAATGDFHATVEYAEMFASAAGDFLDLRQAPTHPSLGRDIAAAYPLGNTLADHARANAGNGISYPSGRHAGGSCLALLRPAAVQSVRQGDVFRRAGCGTHTPSSDGPLTG